MLRTNASLLSYIEELYASEKHSENLFLKQFAAEQAILKQDERPAKLFIIKDGVAKCYISEENDKDYIVEFLGSGEIVGEIEAIRNTASLCHVKAITCTAAYCLRTPFFRWLLSEDKNFNRLLIEGLAERVVNTSSRAAFQQLYTLEHGLSKLLALQTRQGISISKEDMAAYLGVSLRSLNRSMKNLV